MPNYKKSTVHLAGSSGVFEVSVQSKNSILEKDVSHEAIRAHADKYATTAFIASEYILGAAIKVLSDMTPEEAAKAETIKITKPVG